VSIGADSCRVSLGHWLDQVAAGQDVVVTRRGRPIVRLTAAAPAPHARRAAVAPPVLVPPPLLSPPPVLRPPASGEGSA